eukprot:697721-Pyramimonas_sp.AAC.1
MRRRGADLPISLNHRSRSDIWVAPKCRKRMSCTLNMRLAKEEREPSLLSTTYVKYALLLVCRAD